MAPPFPLPLSSYPATLGLVDTLRTRVAMEPVNAAATLIFVLAIAHTFGAARFMAMAHNVQEAHDARAVARGERRLPSVLAELLHFFGEVEVVFGLWAVVLLIVVTVFKGWETATNYFNETVNYTEAALRGRDHGARLDAAGRRASPRARCGASPTRAAARPRPGG